MKKLITILMILLIPISYAGAEEEKTLDVDKDKTLILLKGYLPMVARYNAVFFPEKMAKENVMTDVFDFGEEQRRMIGFDRSGVGGERTSFSNRYENDKNNTPSFSWIIIPNIKESQPSGIIQFTYSF